MKLRQRHIDQYGESINALRGIRNLHRKISRIKMRNYNVSVSSWRKYEPHHNSLADYGQRNNIFQKTDWMGC